MSQEWDCIIVGAGIGGLSCAQFLRKARLRVCILEREAQLSELGAGLQLAPNALAALQEIKLADAALANGWRLARVELRSTRSGLLTSLEAGARPLLAMHRAQLQKLLARNLDPENLHFGVQLQEIRSVGDRVQVHLKDGRSLETRLLIGADGLHSQVRQLIFPPVTIRYSGSSSYRGIVSLPGFLADPQVGAEIWGPGCRFGYAAISRNDIYWYLTFDAPPQQRRDAAARREHALELMQFFPEQRPLVAQTDNEQLIPTDICDIKPHLRWVHDRIGLVGDAAHATTPNLGQGAAQALEDAWALGLAVRKFGPEPIALSAYQSARESKALWIVDQSWRFQSLCHLRRPWLQSLRDWTVQHMPLRLQQAKMERIYTPEVGLPPRAETGTETGRAS